MNDFPWREHARHKPDDCALILNGEPLSWRQLAHRVDVRVNGFRQQGVHSGCGVVLRAKNSATTLLAWLALLQAGVRLLPLNPQLPDTLLAELLPGLNMDFILNLDGPCACSLPALRIQALSGHDRHRQEPQAIATLTLTSGSSGLPKAAAHTFAALLASARAVNQLMAFTAGERWLLSLPLFHVSGQGIVWRWLAAGATLVVDEHRPLAQALAQASWASLVPTQLWRLLRQPQLPASLKAVLLGGAAIPPELVAQAEARGISCWCGYGMTETASTVCGKRADGRSGVGVPLGGREVRLVDGEIRVRADSLACGYWRAGELVPLTDADGWLHTRDRGAWIDGELQVLGRLDNLFFSAGEAVQPEQVERVLLRHPAVLQVFVVPRADSEFGHRPVALLELATEEHFEEIAAWAKTQLAGFQRPVEWFTLPATLSNGGIKISRQRLQQWVALQPVHV
ncbi:O-succinylbenzoate--CoA ligase [Paramixta manurensis]|uniref:O-succinylbenzoate--CoA ligase n=2 Tax=Paramixta manurensis TaxID=2740817 RepID=A0A6M8UG75_9GAMM|nr:O-succinylbenzoate--CoA ligase [Erwiniaceae bacterium PD-1]